MRPPKWPEIPLPSGFQMIRSERRARRTHVTRDASPPWQMLCGLQLSVAAARPVAEPVDVCGICVDQVYWARRREVGIALRNARREAQS